MILRLVDIGEIVNHHCLNFLFSHTISTFFSLNCLTVLHHDDFLGYWTQYTSSLYDRREYFILQNVLTLK